MLRASSPLDRRVKLIRLTEAGTAVYRKIRERADGFRGDLLSGLDPAALATATTLLETLQARLEQPQ